MLFFFIMRYSIDINIKIKAVLGCGVSEIYKDDTVGSIYKLRLLLLPDDSLTEFYWDGNYALAGNIKPGKEIPIEQGKMIAHYFFNSRKSIANIKTKYGTLIFINILSEYDGMIISFIYDIDNGIGLRIYGSDYTFEESCRVALIILYGEPIEYTVVVTNRLPHPDDYEDKEK